MDKGRKSLLGNPGRAGRSQSVFFGTNFSERLSSKATHLYAFGITLLLAVIFRSAVKGLEISIPNTAAGREGNVIHLVASIYAVLSDPPNGSASIRVLVERAFGEQTQLSYKPL